MMINMLVSIDYKDKSKSLYKCDSCNTPLTNDNLIKVVVNKTYHLCPKCFGAIRRFVKKEKGDLYAN